MSKFNFYKIHTGMGKVYDNKTIPFLNDEQFRQFNDIGYSGGYKNGTWLKYLNSLDLGTFGIEQTRHDGGDFTADYIIARFVDEVPNEERFPASMAKAIADKAGMEMKRVYIDEYDRIIEYVQRQADKNNYFVFIKEISSYVYEMLIEDGYVIDEPDYEMEDSHYCIKWE